MPVLRPIRRPRLPRTRLGTRIFRPGIGNPIFLRGLSNFAAGSGASSATTFSLTPTGQQQDDWLVIFVVTVGGAATITNTAGGLTEITGQLTQGATTTVSLWKKKCGAGESGTTYTWTVATGRRWAGIVTCWGGVDPIDVVDGVNVFLEGANV